LNFASNCNEKTAPRRAAFKETGERSMAKAPPSAKRDRIKAFTPALVDYTNDVIYGDLWERKALSKRDRSLITVAALVATYRPEQLVSHLSRAIANGVTQEEITEVIYSHGVLCWLACRDVSRSGRLHGAGRRQ
jgi:4-carboxymuconolactone decarboxylase